MRLGALSERAIVLARTRETNLGAIGTTAKSIGRLIRLLLKTLVCSLGFLHLMACTTPSQEVTVYVSVDRHIAEPVLKQFEAETRIKVSAIYDSEANKSIGLANRLLAEVNRPRADVFWNGEQAQMYRLESAGLLAELPAGLREHGNTTTAVKWIPFAARVRVLLVRNLEASSSIGSILHLGDARWRGRVAVANPHFGSSGAHFAGLLAAWGEKGFRSWLRSLRENQVAVLPGNAQVKNAVAAGEFDVGLTDTDDALEAVQAGDHVALVIPDQEDGGLGAYIVPNTVAVIVGAPHPTQAFQLLSYLISAKVEGQLAKGRGAQLPVHNPGLQGPSLLPSMSKIKKMAVDAQAAGNLFERMLQIVDEEWSH